MGGRNLFEERAIPNNAKAASCSSDHGTVNGNDLIGSWIIERSQLVALLLADKDSVTKRKRTRLSITTLNL